MKTKRTVKMPLRRPSTKSRTKSSGLRARAADPDYELEDYEEESEPNMRFSHALFVVLILHVIAVAGVFAFNSIKARQTSDSAPATVETAEVEKQQAVPKPGTHTVVAGDTLTRIASLYGTTIQAIEKENAINTYSTIRVGQELRIPKAQASASPAAATAAPAPKGTAPAAKPTPIPARVVATASNPVRAEEAASRAEQFLATRKTSNASAQPVAATPVETTAGSEVPATSEALPADGTYTVVAGDNPYSIARKFGVSYQQLIEVNEIEDPTKVQIGQVLKLPR